MQHFVTSLILFRGEEPTSGVSRVSSSPFFVMAKLSAYTKTFVPLYHTACSGIVSTIRNVDKGRLLDQVFTVRRHLVSRGYRCPRCKLFLTDANDVVPSWDERDFVPMERRDQSGLVGFGPDHAAGSEG